MKKITGWRTVNPMALDETQRAQFTQELYQLHCQIFAGADEETFYHEVVDPQAKRTRIRIFLGEQSEPIGYCAVHIFEKKIHGRYYTICRTQAGLLLDYRGHRITLFFGFKEAFRYRLLHPFKRFSYLGIFVHPGIYHMMVRFFPEIYPTHRTKTPEDIIRFLDELANAFGMFPIRQCDSIARRGYGHIL